MAETRIKLINELCNYFSKTEMSNIAVDLLGDNKKLGGQTPYEYATSFANEILKQKVSLQELVKIAQKVNGKFPKLSNNCHYSSLNDLTRTILASEDNTIEKIKVEKSRNPKSAILLLFSTLEMKLKYMLGSLGYLKVYKLWPATEMMLKQTQRKNLLNDINELRKIQSFVDDDKLNNKEISFVVDEGIRIVRELRDIPYNTYKVVSINIPLYSNIECTQKVKGVKAIIIEETYASTGKKEIDVWPTTKNHFIEGEFVAYEMGKQWSKMWYKNVENCSSVCGSAQEFIGRNLKDGKFK
ncbi:hypothetical protein [Candidatus Uabimicrobium sp. HlEnr_7]|uniref:hypothetical protein n=1 Tax=Candidatus Uabimicrobium helgolandensis TaxID=3095367 RepID=UPI0035565070